MATSGLAVVLVRWRRSSRRWTGIYLITPALGDRWPPGDSAVAVAMLTPATSTPAALNILHAAAKRSALALVAAAGKHAILVPGSCCRWRCRLRITAALAASTVLLVAAALKTLMVLLMLAAPVRLVTRDLALAQRAAPVSWGRARWARSAGQAGGAPEHSQTIAAIRHRIVQAPNNAVSVALPRFADDNGSLLSGAIGRSRGIWAPGDHHLDADPATLVAGAWHKWTSAGRPL